MYLVFFIFQFFLFAFSFKTNTSFSLRYPQIFETVNTFLSSQFKNYSDIFSESQIDEFIANTLNYIPSILQNALLQLNAGFSTVMNALLYLIIIPFLVFFFLKDKTFFLENLKILLPAKRELLSTIWKDLNLQLYGYLKGKGLEMLIVTLVTGIVFYFQDVNYSIILAILIGLSVLIPYVGAILVTIPVVIIGLFQWGLETSFYIYILSYLLIQALDGNVLMPLLLGREVKLHPVYIITAVLIFGGIWGFGDYFLQYLLQLFESYLSILANKGELTYFL